MNGPPVESHAAPPAARVARGVLLGVAVLLLAVACAGMAFTDLRLSLGPIRISATDPSRVLLEAAAAWLLAILIAPPRRRPLAHTLLALVGLLLAGVADSSPRRVGDGAEYVAMALNMSHGRPPALSPEELTTAAAAMRRMPGFEDTTLVEPLVGRDGRQDFYHPWLYPLLAAPLAAVTAAAGAHINHAFTALNLVALVALAWFLIRTGRREEAVALAAGPVLWWIDKAHTEVFLFVTLAFAVTSLGRAPVAALAAAGAATAQNPAAGVVLAVCALSTLVRAPRSPRTWRALLAGGALASLTPAYYMWHLGAWSPLAGTLLPTVPSWRALVTPLIDPNLGLIAYAPVLAGLALAGVSRTGGRATLVWLATSMALMGVFALTPNVNHGGSPGMSRYALWLLAVAVPLITLGSDRLRLRHVWWLRIGVAVSVAFSLVAFRPAASDREGTSPNWLAARLWTSWPGLDNPLPEVFAERTVGIDGAVPTPAATARCEKILIRGDGREAWWPMPCVPSLAPPACMAEAALCYVNAGRFTTVPSQPSFLPSPMPAFAWTLSTADRSAALLELLGTDRRFVRFEEPGGRIEGAREVLLYIVEGASGAAVWLESIVDPARPPELELRLAVASTIEIRDQITLERLDGSRSLPPGLHTVSLPQRRSLLMTVVDAQ